MRSLTLRDRDIEVVRGLLPRRLVLLDVGARGGLQLPWAAARSLLYAIHFEPESVEADRLSGTLTPAEGRVINAALWEKCEPVTLHLTRSLGCSSVYRPNRELVDHFAQAERFDVEREVQIRATTLDALGLDAIGPTADFLKVDTQGAEMAILKGGRKLLRRELAGLEIEVAFSPVYSGMPLFAEIDAYVREELGLQLWDIRKTFWKYRAGASTGPPKGQAIFGDALYFRPLDRIGSWAQAAEKITMLAMSSALYGYFDYALAVLDSESARALVHEDQRTAFVSAIRRAGRTFRPMREGHGGLYGGLTLLAHLFKPAHGGWASVSEQLGSRRRWIFWT